MVIDWLLSPAAVKFYFLVITITLLLVVIKIIQSSITNYIKDSETRYKLKKLVSFGGYFLCLVIIASVFSDRLGGLGVTLGLATAGIAFALQEVIASVAGWFAISVGNFYKPGDRVQLGGIKGDVIDINIFRTTLMELGEWVKADLYTGRIVRIANSFVFKEPVFNYSGDFPFLWDEIVLPIKYGSDYSFARKLFQEIADQMLKGYSTEATKVWRDIEKNYLLEQVNLEPIVTLVANDNWVEFTIRYVVDYKKRRITKDLLFTKILEELEKTNGRVSMASATFHLVETPVFEVKVTESEKIKQ